MRQSGSCDACAGGHSPRVMGSPTDAGSGITRDTALPGMAAGTVVCWVIGLDVPAEVLESGCGLLDPGELERAGRYPLEHLRRRFMARRIARRLILGASLGVDAVSVDFREVGSGKPEVVRDESVPVHFSASHSEDVAVVAVSAKAPVGVDVEVYRMVEGSLWEVRHLFADSERSALERVSERERSRLFFDCWTRKEACVKADGAGMALDLDSFEVPVGRIEEDGVTVSFARGGGGCRAVRLRSLDLGEELSGAVAVAVAGRGIPEVVVRAWDWGEVLRA